MISQNGMILILLGVFLGIILGIVFKKKMPEKFHDENIQKVIDDPELLVEKLKSNGRIFDGQFEGKGETSKRVKVELVPKLVLLENGMKTIEIIEVPVPREKENEIALKKPVGENPKVGGEIPIPSPEKILLNDPKNENSSKKLKKRDRHKKSSVA